MADQVKCKILRIIRALTPYKVVVVQLLLVSCTGYGVVYDDKRQYDDLDSSEYEQNCLKQPTSDCLLTSALTISSTMSDKVAQSEALTVVAKTYFELGNQAVTLKTVADIPVLTMQFSALFQLTALARSQQKSAADFLTLANSITATIEQPKHKLAALLLNAILSFKNQDPQRGTRKLKQALRFANVISATHDNILDLALFTNLLPILLQFDTFDAINQLISLQTTASRQFSARVEYALLLKKQYKPTLAQQQLSQLLNQWPALSTEQQKLAQASIVKLYVSFDKLAQATAIREQQTQIAGFTTAAVIISQLTSDGKIKQAKQELVGLLQAIRLYEPEVRSGSKSIRAKTAKAQAYNQDNFIMDNLRAQAIADLALALSRADRLTEAVYFAEQIQVLMGHIQGYTLTKLALLYARRADINNALLTMESIHRPVNRAACLAQISAVVAKSGDLKRAIIIANRVNRQSWRDIALSDISIAQARQQQLTAAMKTLDSIQRSYSAVYAMSEIARTFKATQNKR